MMVALLLGSYKKKTLHCKCFAHLEYDVHVHVVELHDVLKLDFGRVILPDSEKEDLAAFGIGVRQREAYPARPQH